MKKPKNKNKITGTERNNLCICGSGKKYKHCCGKNNVSQNKIDTKQNYQLKKLLETFHWAFYSTDKNGKPLILDALQKQNKIPVKDSDGKEYLYNMRWREIIGNLMTAMIFEYKDNYKYLIREPDDDTNDGYIIKLTKEFAQKMLNRDKLLLNENKKIQREAILLKNIDISEIDKKYIIPTEHLLIYEHDKIPKNEDELCQLFANKVFNKLNKKDTKEESKKYIDNKLFIFLDHSEIKGEYDLSKCLNKLREKTIEKGIDYFFNTFVYINLAEQNIIDGKTKSMVFNVTLYMQGQQVNNIPTMETYSLYLDFDSFSWKVKLDKVTKL